MERKWFTKSQRRINNLSKAEIYRHTTNKRNTFHIQKLLPHTKLQTMSHYPSRRNCTRRHSNTHKKSIQHYELLKYQEESIQATSIKVRGFPYEITVAAAYCPPKYNLKKEQFQTFFQTLGPKVIAGATTRANTLYGAPD